VGPKAPAEPRPGIEAEALAGGAEGWSHQQGDCDPRHGSWHPSGIPRNLGGVELLEGGCATGKVSAEKTLPFLFFSFFFLSLLSFCQLEAESGIGGAGAPKGC